MFRNSGVPRQAKPACLGHPSIVWATRRGKGRGTHGKYEVNKGRATRPKSIYGTTRARLSKKIWVAIANIVPAIPIAQFKLMRG
jgi:hypothetical protein